MSEISATDGSRWQQPVMAGSNVLRQFEVSSFQFIFGARREIEN